MRDATRRFLIRALARRARRALGAAVVLSSAGIAQDTRGALTQGMLAVSNVSVIPMTGDTIMRNVTVLVRDGRIASISPARTARVPAGIRTIDGTGRYLIPGLADMHTHLFSDDAVHDSVAPAELGVMIANGVTAARLMIGTPEHLVLRRQVAEGVIPGPQLFVASPQLTGKPATNALVVTTPDAARSAVKSAREDGYDFIKLTTDITRPVYDAIVAEARAQKLPVVGHVDLQVGLARALEAGQQIEHLDAYMEAVLADSGRGRPSVSNYGLYALRQWATLDYIDDRKVQEVAGTTARAGVYSTPTLTIFNLFGQPFDDDEIRSRPDWKLLPEGFRTGYWRAKERLALPANLAARTPERRSRYVAVRNALTKAISDSGGRIMAGSDTPEWFHVYGFALHRELANLVAAGLTPYQALQAATVTPAEFLGVSNDWGTVEPRKRADLVLLAANPLEDIRNTARIEGVALGGRWFEEAELRRMIDRAAQLLSGPSIP